MLLNDLLDLLEKDPFEPFRITLVNGSYHDISLPWTVTFLRRRVFITTIGGEWALFPFEMVVSLESLLADFQGGPPRE